MNGNMEHSVGDDGRAHQLLRHVVRAVISFPGVRVNRATYLRNQLRIYCRNSGIDLNTVIETNPLAANVPIAKIDKLANASIRKHTVQASGVSAATGVPGGIALLATVPADLAQYYWHALRCAQELAYLYGWPDLFEENELQMDDDTETKLILLLGALNGIDSASELLMWMARQVGKEQARRLPRQALTKTRYYPIVTKVARQLGYRMNKQVFGRSVGKLIPLLGAVAAGGMTALTFQHMTNGFKKHLRETALEVSPEGDGSVTIHVTPEETSASTIAP